MAKNEFICDCDAVNKALDDAHIQELFWAKLAHILHKGDPDNG